MKEKLWSRNFIFVILINFFIFSNHFAMIAIFPFYVESLGGTEAISGIMAALFSTVAVISRPVFGWLLDNGKRCKLLLLGILLMGVTTLGYRIVSSILFLFIVRMTGGAGISCASTSSSTITSDVVPKKRFAEGMGIFGLAITLATAVAPSAGLAFMRSGGFSFLFNAGTALMVIALILLVFLRDERLAGEKKPFQLRSLFESEAVPASLVVLFFMVTFGALETFIAKYAVSVGLPGDYSLLVWLWLFC